jgi:hypothetical protein
MHARVIGTVMMIMTPELRRVCQNIFDNNCHALYIWQEILRMIIGSVDTAHTKYDTDCLDW